MPWVLVLPPRSNEPGFHRPRSWSGEGVDDVLQVLLLVRLDALLGQTGRVVPLVPPLPVDESRGQRRQRAAQDRVERPPEERVDAALEVEEEDEHGGEPIEHPAAGSGRRQPEPRAATRLLLRSLTPLPGHRTESDMCRARRGLPSPDLAAKEPRTTIRRWCLQLDPPDDATCSRLGDAARVMLAAIRIFNGVMGLLAPARPARRIGSPEGTPLYPWRMFGIRTVFIGAELLSRDPARRDRAVRLALPIHASDTVSAALGGLRGETSRRTSLLLTAISGTNTLLALLARRTLR